MEPKKIKRLVLNKETISSLDQQEQNELKGGTGISINQTCTQKCSIWCASDSCTAESNRDCNPWSYDCLSNDCDRTENCTDGWYCW